MWRGLDGAWGGGQALSCEELTGPCSLCGPGEEGPGAPPSGDSEDASGVAAELTALEGTRLQARDLSPRP